MSEFSIPYIASLSPLLRFFYTKTEVGCRAAYALRKQIEGVVEYFDINGEGLGLKVPVPGGNWLRQMDLRTEPNGPILFKTFTQWDSENKLWIVRVESAKEHYWEQQNKQLKDVN